MGVDIVSVEEVMMARWMDRTTINDFGYEVQVAGSMACRLHLKLKIKLMAAGLRVCKIPC